MQRTKDKLFALRHHVLLPASALPSVDLSLSRNSMSVVGLLLLLLHLGHHHERAW